ncbi:TRAP transporter TAXI family solute receptor [Pseudarthrobacter sp. SLBN-100]
MSELSPLMTARSMSRRGLLKAGVAAGLAGMLLPGLAACSPEDPVDSLIVAGGEPGGFYLEFATLLATSLQRNGVARHATALPTGGSLDNLEHLLGGRATFAVALADAAAQRAAGKSASEAGITALGRVYENYVHCVVRQDGGIGSIAELAGRTVAVGEPGAGTSLTTPRLLEAARLTSVNAGGGSAGSGRQAVTVLNLGLNDGLSALRDGSVDALFWSGGVPTRRHRCRASRRGAHFPGSLRPASFPAHKVRRLLRPRTDPGRSIRRTSRGVDGWCD